MFTKSLAAIATLLADDALAETAYTQFLIRMEARVIKNASKQYDSLDELISDVLEAEQKVGHAITTSVAMMKLRLKAEQARKQ